MATNMGVGLVGEYPVNAYYRGSQQWHRRRRDCRRRGFHPANSGGLKTFKRSTTDQFQFVQDGQFSLVLKDLNFNGKPATVRSGGRQPIMKKKGFYQYAVFIESCEEGGYFADCPSLPGCHVQGETLEEILKETRAAIDAYLDDMKARHEPIPRPQQVTVTSIAVAV